MSEPENHAREEDDSELNNNSRGLGKGIRFREWPSFEQVLSGGMEEFVAQLRSTSFGFQEKPAAALIPAKATIRLETVRTNDKEYGPYYYAYWRDGSKLRKRYIGKHLPPELRAGRQRSSKRLSKDISAAMKSMFDVT